MTNRKKVLGLVLTVAILLTACSEKRHKEKYYQTKLCEELNGVMEQSLLDRTRVDCLTKEYAIEVDFAKKWAEAVGQSLYYASMTGKKPGIGIIVGESNKDTRNIKRLEVLTEKYDIKLFKIEKGD